MLFFYGKYILIYDFNAEYAKMSLIPKDTLVNIKAPEVTYNALVSAFVSLELDKTQYQQSL